VLRLLEEGVNVNETDTFGMTALNHASYRGHSETVRLLLANGANVDHKNEE
jgi:ankyrin repeat protein